MSRVRRYEGDGISVSFEPRRCIHAGECVRGLPLVFDPQGRPWVKLDGADDEAVAQVVERCPTGALGYERPGQPGEPVPEHNSIQVRPRGPLYVRGDIELALPDGGIVRGTRMVLCRCGGSSNKPFCDNSHRDRAFDDPGALSECRLRSDGAESATLRLKVLSGGAMVLNGPVEVVGTDSEVQHGEKGSLCRCGASSAMPYCDASHRDIDFESE